MRLFYSLTLAVLMAAGVALTGSGPAASAGDKASASANDVKLERLTWSQFQRRLVNSRVKYSIVDAWSTTCGPCKENFPHVVEMHRKYAPRGLAVISLSLDDP